MLQPRMNSRSATPLHASCPQHSSHFLVKIRRTLYQKKAQNLGFHLIFNSWFLLFLKTTGRYWSLKKFELLSQTLTSRRLWTEGWKLVKSCEKIYCNFWCSSMMLNCSESSQVDKKFQFVLKTLNLSSDFNESSRVKTRASRTLNELEHDLWLLNDS
jgi:hypothetical protein